MNTEKENQELTPDKVRSTIISYDRKWVVDSGYGVENARRDSLKIIEDFGQQKYDQGLKDAEQSKWIPVEERPPQEDQIVICIGDGRRPSMAKYQKGQFIRYVDHVEGERVFVIQYTNITHWQPSPDLPEQGKEKE